MKSVLGTSKAEVKVISAVEHMANKIFQLYSNFLLEEARQPWNKILAKEINSSPWKDLRGIVHNTPRSKTRDSFKECVTLHMLTVFRNNAAEAQMYYICNCLKKPSRVPIRQFVRHMQQLNHNMSDCWKYKKDSKIKKGLSKVSVVRGSTPLIKRLPVHLYSF